MMLGFFAFTIYQSGDENFIIDSSVSVGNNTIANEPLSVISVFPNPASNQLNVNLFLKNESQQTSIKVLNETGELVYENNLGRIPSGLRTHRIETDAWCAGIYFIKVENTWGEILSAEFIKQ